MGPLGEPGIVSWRGGTRFGTGVTQIRSSVCWSLVGMAIEVLQDPGFGMYFWVRLWTGRQSHALNASNAIIVPL